VGAALLTGAALAAVSLGWTSGVAAQQPQGGALFAQHCASCHSGASDSRAPSPEALRLRSPEAIVLALTNGPMRLQGSRFGGLERRAIAEYLTGRVIGVDVAGAATGRCSTAEPSFDLATGPQWRTWGGTFANTRFQSASAAGLTPDQVPRLTLKWALGYPDATHAWSQPTLAGGRLYVGSQNGTVYSLDAKSGCVRWTFVAGGGVRTAITIADGSVIFGDTNAVVYALDAAQGRERWRMKIDSHPLGRVTGSPAVHDGRVFVPVSSYEEVDTASPEYECCTFRGSVVALESASGKTLWRTYMVSEPKPRGTSTAGRTLWGPSGGGVWAALTIDPKRSVVYAATGNTYSEPASPLSDAVVALDMHTGGVRWANQTTPDDVYIGGCRPGSNNPNCPSNVGPDFDFGNPAILTTRPDGKEIIVIGQKSGVGYAMDPDNGGKVLWEYRAGQGGALGGMEYGSAADGRYAYFPLSDMNAPAPGGLHAVDLTTGTRAWYAPPVEPRCAAGRGCNAAQAAAVTVIPGVVFSGVNDGVFRAYSTADGRILWEFDTNREFTTVNGVPGRGASILGPGPAVAGGMVYVNSGYGSHGGRPGNVLLAFGLE
jgi:polyvinyl alcohol dehydrogenase (cytochrome)